MLRIEERECVEVRRWCNHDEVSTTYAYQIIDAYVFLN